MSGSVTKAAVLLSTTPPRRRVLALSAPELGMLLRFAVLRQLHADAAPTSPAQQLTTLAAVAYVGAQRIEGAERLWPFLDGLAADWIRQRGLS